MKKCCETCKYFFEDESVGATDCTNESIEEDEIEKYYTDGEEGCPHWVAKYSEKELAAEAAYFESFFEASRSFTEDAHEYVENDVKVMIDLYQSSYPKEDKDE